MLIGQSHTGSSQTANLYACGATKQVILQGFVGWTLVGSQVGWAQGDRANGRGWGSMQWSSRETSALCCWEPGSRRGFFGFKPGKLVI